MTGLGYMVFVSGVEIKVIADFFGTDKNHFEMWCRGPEATPEDELMVIAEKCNISMDLLKKPVVSLDMYEEYRLFAAGVILGACLKKDVVKI